MIKKQKGFTLVELLVVMAILGILSTVGLQSFRSSQMKARDAQRKHDLGQIQKALEMYYNDTRSYPLSAADGKIVGCGSSPTPEACDWNNSWQRNDSLYMKTIPQDPRVTYCYSADANGKWYKLYAKLENTEDPRCIPAVPSCSLVRSCGGLTNAFNYGVASTNEVP